MSVMLHEDRQIFSYLLLRVWHFVEHVLGQVRRLVLKVLSVVTRFVQRTTNEPRPLSPKLSPP